MKIELGLFLLKKAELASPKSSFEERRILSELDPSKVNDTRHKKSRQAARDIFILMIDGGFRINEASILQWSDIDFDNSVIYLYRTKVSNDVLSP